MADLVKRPDLEFIVQLQNFSDKLGAYKAALGITDAEADAVAADTDFMTFVTLGSESADSYKQSWTKVKRETRSGNEPEPFSGFPEPVDLTDPPAPVEQGVERRFRDLVARIKANPNYTEAMGEDMGIVADEDTTVLTSPELRIEVEGGNPVISFVKQSSDGIRLYSKRGTEAGFSFLAVDTRSPYVDNRENETPGTPEVREYYAYYMKDDEQVGQQSNIISVKV